MYTLYIVYLLHFGLTAQSTPDLIGFLKSAGFWLFLSLLAHAAEALTLSGATK